MGVEEKLALKLERSGISTLNGQIVFTEFVPPAKAPSPPSTAAFEQHEGVVGTQVGGHGLV